MLLVIPLTINKWNNSLDTCWCKIDFYTHIRGHIVMGFDRPHSLNFFVRNAIALTKGLYKQTTDWKTNLCYKDLCNDNDLFIV